MIGCVLFPVMGGQQIMPPFGNPQLSAPNPPALVNNPWSQSAGQSASVSSSLVVTAAGPSKVSDAEFWLNATASQIDPFAAVPSVSGKSAGHRPRVFNGAVSGQTSPYMMTATAAVHHGSVSPANQQPSNLNSTPVPASEPTSSSAAVNTSRPLITNQSNGQTFDAAFDSAWSSKSNNRSMASGSAQVTNPFQTSVDKAVPAFELKL